MQHESKNRAAVSALLTLIALSVGNTGKASMLPNSPIRELAERADIVVIAHSVPRPMAKPVPSSQSKPDYREPSSFLFVVKQVLLGDGLQPGQPFRMHNDGYYAWDGIRPDWNHYLGEPAGTEPSEFKEVLLFLTSDLNGADADVDYHLLFSGIRLLTTDGRTLVPKQFCIPGAYQFVEARKLPDSWQSQYHIVWGESHLKADFRSIVETLQAQRTTLELLQALRSSNHFRPSIWLNDDEEIRPLSIEISDTTSGEPSDPQEDLSAVQPQADEPQHE